MCTCSQGAWKSSLQIGRHYSDIWFHSPKKEHVQQLQCEWKKNASVLAVIPQVKKCYCFFDQIENGIENYSLFLFVLFDSLYAIYAA